MSVETKLRLLLFSLLALGGVLFFGIIYAFSKSVWITTGVLFFIFIWFLLVDLWQPQNSKLRLFQDIISKPYVYVKIVFDIVLFFIATTQAYLFCWVYTIAPLAILLTVLKLIVPAISLKLITFLVISFSSILMVNYTNFLKEKMLKKGIFSVWNQEDSKKKIVEIGMYMLQPKNAHFIVLILYVVFLVAIAFMQLQCNSPLITQGIDDAIWKAFLVFIAFTNMKKGYAETESDSIILLAKLLKMCHWLPKDMEKLLDDNSDSPKDDEVKEKDAEGEDVDAK